MVAKKPGIRLIRLKKSGILGILKKKTRNSEQKSLQNLKFYKNFIC